MKTLLLKLLCFYGFYRKEFDGLEFICGYLTMLCSVILLLIIYKTGCASKFLVCICGVTPLWIDPFVQWLDLLCPSLILIKVIHNHNNGNKIELCKGMSMCISISLKCFRDLHLPIYIMWLA